MVIIITHAFNIVYFLISFLLYLINHTKMCNCYFCILIKHKTKSMFRLFIYKKYYFFVHFTKNNKSIRARNITHLHDSLKSFGSSNEKNQSQYLSPFGTVTVPSLWVKSSSQSLLKLPQSPSVSSMSSGDGKI